MRRSLTKGRGQAARRCDPSLRHRRALRRIPGDARGSNRAREPTRTPAHRPRQRPNPDTGSVHKTGVAQQCALRVEDTLIPMSTLASLRAEVARTIAALPEVFRSCSADVLCDVIAPEFTEDDHNRCAHDRIPPQLPFPIDPSLNEGRKQPIPPNGARADPRGFRAHPDRSTSQTPDRGPIPNPIGAVQRSSIPTSPHHPRSGPRSSKP